MADFLIKQLYTQIPEQNLTEVTLKGWVRTKRESKTFAFIELNDGSYFKNLQIVVSEENVANYSEVISQVTTGASISVTGTLVLTPEMKQPFELKAESLEIVGECPSSATEPRDTCLLICLILASGATGQLPAHVPDTRQLSPATPARSSA